MLLIESDLHLEGSAAEVLNGILLPALVRLLEAECLMRKQDAHAIAEAHLSRVHQLLAAAGYVVRDLTPREGTHAD